MPINTKHQYGTAKALLEQLTSDNALIKAIPRLSSRVGCRQSDFQRIAFKHGEQHRTTRLVVETSGVIPIYMNYRP